MGEAFQGGRSDCGCAYEICSDLLNRFRGFCGSNPCISVGFLDDHTSARFKSYQFLKVVLLLACCWLPAAACLLLAVAAVCCCLLLLAACLLAGLLAGLLAACLLLACMGNVPLVIPLHTSFGWEGRSFSLFDGLG